jgi:hypothetical protein
MLNDGVLVWISCKKGRELLIKLGMWYMNQRNLGNSYVKAVNITVWRNMDPRICVSKFRSGGDG